MQAMNSALLFITTMTSLIVTSRGVIRLESRDLRDDDVSKRQSSDTFDTLTLEAQPDFSACHGRVFGVCHMKSQLYIGCTSYQENSLYIYDSHTLQQTRQILFLLDQEATPFSLSCYEPLNKAYILALSGFNFGSKWSVKTLSPDAEDIKDSSTTLIDDVGLPIRISVSPQGGGKLIVLSTYKINVFSLDGAFLSEVDSPVKDRLKYDVIMLESGNLLVTNIIRERKIGDVTEIDPSGQIVGSYKARCSTTCAPLDVPRYIEPFSPDLYFVSDWQDALDNGGGLYLVRGDLTGGRVLVKGKKDRMEFPQEMSYDPESKLLIVAQLFDSNIRVFRVNT